MSGAWTPFSAISTLPAAGCAVMGSAALTTEEGGRDKSLKLFCSYERELLHLYSCIQLPLAPSNTGGHERLPAGLKMGKVVETLAHGESYRETGSSIQ